MEKHQIYSILLNDIFKQKKVGKLFIDSITVNSISQNYEKEGSFNFDQNNLTIYYDYRDINTKRETEIVYTLDGFNSKWLTTSPYSNEITYESLPVGDYSFRIKAKYVNKESDVYTYSFSVLPPFWQRLWFIVLLVLFFGIITILWFKRRKRKIKIKIQELLEKEQLSKNLAESELKALRSQMNPHFIFNSLNSIQSLVLKQDIDKSYDYISLFAKLVRNSLSYSESEFISLDKEIEFLDIYLKLENLRFNEDFTYKIDNQISDFDVKVPSLVIQPFIENSLLHGILHKKGEKRLDILFTFNDKLTCTIIDNGIGRKKAQEIKDRQGQSHESFSTRAIKKRMEILSEKLHQEAKFEYFDIIGDAEVIGTRVVIILPFETIS